MTGRPTTGKYSIKPYRCDTCGAESKVGTNHWGKVYNQRCRSCAWKHPMELQTFTCLKACPESHDLPTEWKTVRLGDLLEEV